MLSYFRLKCEIAQTLRLSMFYAFRVVFEWLSRGVLSAQTLRRASIIERGEAARTGQVERNRECAAVLLSRD